MYSKPASSSRQYPLGRSVPSAAPRSSISNTRSRTVR